MNGRAYVAAFTATFSVVLLAGLHHRAWWLTLLPFAGYVAGWADNAANFQWAPTRWTVYYLFDRDGFLVYVGSTNDAQRRCLEHTNPAAHDHKPAVHAVTIARYCRSERQTRRIEQRRIRALTVASTRSWPVQLLNDTFTLRAAVGGVIAWRTAWMGAYWCESWLHPERRWHRPNTSTTVIPRRETGDETDDWGPPTGPDVDPRPTSDDTVTEATYARPAVYALGPARNAPHNVTDPSMPPRRGGSPNRDVTGDVTDRPNRTRPESNAERQRAYRDRQRQRDGR